MIKRVPLEVPAQVAQQFVEDMRAFFAEENAIKRDEIAARQLHALSQRLRPGDRKLRLSDIKGMFVQMRDETPGNAKKSRDPSGQRGKRRN